MDPALQEILSSYRTETVEALVRLRHPSDPPVGLNLVTQIGDIATVRVSARNLERVWADPRICSLKAPRLLSRVDEQITKARSSKTVTKGVRPTRPAGLGETGYGVAIGVFDWGFDLRSAAFRNPDGTTRVKAIWAQGAPHHRSAARYGYGRIALRDEINTWLRSGTSFDEMGLGISALDRAHGSHGTHVADIAAGSPRHYAPAGIAPQADLILVDLATSNLQGQATLGDSVRIVEAYDFATRAAAGQPLVINNSFGKHGGPCNGLSLVERAIDNFVTATAGRAVVMSTGNYRHAKAHRLAHLGAGETQRFDWIISRKDKTPNELEIWYSNRDAFGLRLIAPDGQTIEVPLGTDVPLIRSGRKIGHAYHRAFDPNSPDHQIDVFLYPPAPRGTWQIELLGHKIADGRYRASIERDAAGVHQSRIASKHASQSGTLGSICNGFFSIAVGASYPRTGRPAFFSSEGPTRDGRGKPDLTAQGVDILAQHSGTTQLIAKTGASQAAPIVTGTVALMFEAAKRKLSIHETKSLLLGQATPQDSTRFRQGAGQVNIKASVDATRIFNKKD